MAIKQEFQRCKFSLVPKCLISLNLKESEELRDAHTYRAQMLSQKNTIMHLSLRSILTPSLVTTFESLSSTVLAHKNTQNPPFLGHMYGFHGITKTWWESRDLTSAWTELI